jgi:pimeloyl-ACP methyl ester carboxylesterase
MENIEHRTVEVNGIKMNIAEKGEGPIVLFLHGFPELWYSWRHQVVALVPSVTTLWHQTSVAMMTLMLRLQ